MNTRMKAIYGRQSVDKQDSISIDSQIEFCQYELKGERYHAYTDKGFSGKNTDRPKFQELIRDIEQGLISTVIVYKLDRISRSIIDFARMMELFQRYNVEFVSATEKFDTSTPMGRAMLNICIVFAQLERETCHGWHTGNSYFRCRKRADSRACEGCGTLRVHEFEQSIYSEMVKKLQVFQVLTKGNPAKANPKLTALNVELAEMDNEIEKLLDSLTGANPTLLSYANSKIEELDTKRQSLMKAIADMRTSTLSPECAKSISGYLTNWDDVSFEDRRLVVDGLIAKIQATSENVRIEWKV